MIDKWFQIGVQLGVGESNLRQIRADNHTVHICFTEAISFWLNGNTQVAVSWDSIIDVLESHFVNEKGLADQLREKAGLKCDDKQEVPSSTGTCIPITFIGIIVYVKVFTGQKFCQGQL